MTRWTTLCRGAMERFIMTGYGGGWKGCDLIVSNELKIIHEVNPQFVANVDALSDFVVRCCKVEWRWKQALNLLVRLEKFSCKSYQPRTCEVQT